MPPSPPRPSTQFSLLLLGDIVLARLIDALLPTSIARSSPHTDPESAAKTVDRLLTRNEALRGYGYGSPWGNALGLLRGRERGGCDALVGNLECAFTLGEGVWAGKRFCYRSHTGNVGCLVEAGFGSTGLGTAGRGDTRDDVRIMEMAGGKEQTSGSRGYVSLANNHVLDWGVQGMHETVLTLEDAGIAFAGAGRTREEAERPARLLLGEGGEYVVHCYSFSDHPSDWKGIEGFNFIDYSASSRERIKKTFTRGDDREKPALKVVSLHCGPNYRWHPDEELIELTRFLIDECGVDLIVGHSSHHIQGVQVYKGRLVVYGCGDFVDDYAVVEGGWRNDLSGAWRVSVKICDEGERVSDEGEEGSGKGGDDGKQAGQERGKLRITKLEMFPNRIQSFSAHLLEKDDEDHVWVQRKFRELCEGFGTRVERELGEDGQIVVNVLDQG
jgi:hypothetical protein